MAKKERKTKSKSVCVCSEKRNDATDNLRSNIFWVFFFSLISYYVPVCVCEEVEAKGKQNIPPGQEIFECTTT